MRLSLNSQCNTNRTRVAHQPARRPSSLHASHRPMPATHMTTDRRALISGLIASTIGMNLSMDSMAMASEPLSTYQDAEEKYQVAIPPDWIVETSSISGGQGGYSGYTGDRKTVILIPSDPNVRDVSISIVGTNVSFEFTKLGSFGNVYAFASNLVGSQDRSNLLRTRSLDSATEEDPIQIAKLIDAVDRGGQIYEVEYTVQKFPSPIKRHLFSAVSVGFNGKYNQLYTITGQCREEDLQVYRDLLIQTVRSFKSELKPVY